MTDITEITNVLASIADGDLIYLGEDLGGSTYDDAAGTALTLKNYVLTGPLAVIGSASAGASIRLPEDTDNGSHYVAIKAPDSLAGTYTLTLPADDGDADQYLKTDGSGGLSWATVSGASAPLTLTGGTVTDPSTPLTITQTWNDAADTFVGLDVAITNTASAGASRPLRVTVGGSNVFAVKTDGTYGALNTGVWYDMYGGYIGVSDLTLGTTAIARLYDSGATAGHSIVFNYGIGFSSTGSVNSNYSDVKLHASADGILNLRAGTKTVGAALNLLEQTAPSSPGSNEAIIYAEDNGSGKTRLMVKFATGAAQQIAIEP